MPPKDSKKDKGPKKPECLPPAEVQQEDESSPGFYLAKIAELESRVEKYQEKYKDVLEKNSQLKQELCQKLAEKKEAIVNAKKKLDAKIAEIAQLGEKVRQLEDIIDKENADFREEMLQMETQYKETEAQLTADNKHLYQRLTVVRKFKEERKQLLAHIDKLKNDLVAQAAIHHDEIAQMEQRHITGKNKLKKDILIKLTNVAMDFCKAADEKLPPTTKRTLQENYLMNKRLMSISEEMVHMTKENDRLRETEKSQRDCVKALRLNEVETSKKSVANKKIIKLLKEKCTALEVTVKKFHPRDPSHRHSLADELVRLGCEVDETRDKIASVSTRKDELEQTVFERRYLLSKQRSIGWQLQKVLKNLAWALKDIMIPVAVVDCRDLSGNVLSRDELLESFMSVLNAAREMQFGPTLGDVLSAHEPNFSKALDDRCRKHVEVAATSQSYKTGDVGLVPHTEEFIPTNCDIMRHIIAAREKQMRDMTKELPQNSADKTPKFILSNFFSDRPPPDQTFAEALARMKHLLPSKPLPAILNNEFTTRLH